MLYLLIIFYCALAIIIRWIQVRIRRPASMTDKQVRNLHIAFAVSIPIFIFFLIVFISELTLLEWGIAGGFTLILGLIMLYHYNKKRSKLTTEEIVIAKDLEMTDQEEKVKIMKCTICGKLYNKYTRPWGSRLICSDECELIYAKSQTEEAKKNLNSWRKWETLSCFCFGLLPIIVIIIIFLVIANAAS